MLRCPYCGFEAFKMLAENYLGVDSHDSFLGIQQLFEDIKITPADFGEMLMAKDANADIDARLDAFEEQLEKRGQEISVLKVDKEMTEDGEKMKIEVEKDESDWLHQLWIFMLFFITCGGATNNVADREICCRKLMKHCLVGAHVFLDYFGGWTL